MAGYVQVQKAKVVGDDVEELLSVRPAAIAEAERLCPELWKELQGRFPELLDPG
jgi:hypothetical protein